MQSFSFIPIMNSEEMIFNFFCVFFFFFFFLFFVSFRKFSISLSWQPIKFKGLNKTDVVVGRGLFKEHFCGTFVKISSVR